MGEQILVSVGLADTRVALLAEGRLQEVEIWRPDEMARPGTIYLGRVTSPAPGLDGVFVELGLARPGVLTTRHVGPAYGGDRQAAPFGRHLNEGRAVLVQVRRAPTAGKGALLTTAVTLPGRTLAYRPSAHTTVLSRRIFDAAERTRLQALAKGLSAIGEGGFIVRTAAQGADAVELEREAASLRRRWKEIEAAAAMATPPLCLHRDDDAVMHALRELLSPGTEAVIVDDVETLNRARTWCRAAAPWALHRLSRHDGDASLFERHGVEAEIEAALQPDVALAGGGWLSIEATEAVVAIDVNAGSRAGADRRATAALATNLEAAPEIARQLRLRGLGGLIVVDFLRLESPGEAARVLAALDAALGRDSTPTRRTGFSEFGLIELNRRRRGAPLAERLGEPCDACRGRAWQLSARSLAEALLRRAGAEVRRGRGGTLKLIAAPEVIEALAGLPGLDQESLSLALGCRVRLVAERERARAAFDVAWQEAEAGRGRA